MDDKARLSLIIYRMQQSKDKIELAEFLIRENKLTVAVNRMYYGIYYSLTSLALKYGFETSKHLQLIGWFNKEFILTSRISKKYGRNLTKRLSKSEYGRL